MVDTHNLIYVNQTGKLVQICQSSAVSSHDGIACLPAFSPNGIGGRGEMGIYSPTMLSRPCPAFTLVELTIVIAVLVTLMTLGAVIAPGMVARSQRASTQAVVSALAAAIAADGRTDFQIEVVGRDVARRVPVWDVNNDGWIDGDPTRGDQPHPDPQRAQAGEFEFSATERTQILAHLTNYRGPVHGLSGLIIDDARLDAAGRPMDAWKRPLRILHRGASRAPAGAQTGRHFIGIYSCGPDGIDNDGGGDDIRSW